MLQHLIEWHQMIELKNLRKKMKWSQEKLARELGVSYQTVHRWEKGTSEPSQLAMEKIQFLLKKHK